MRVKSVLKVQKIQTWKPSESKPSDSFRKVLTALPPGPSLSKQLPCVLDNEDGTGVVMQLGVVVQLVDELKVGDAGG